MFLHQLDLTTALRPSLLPEETLLFVQDAVGLYEGYTDSPITRNPWLTMRPQKVQDPSISEWTSLFDFAPSVLC